MKTLNTKKAVSGVFSIAAAIAFSFAWQNNEAQIINAMAGNATAGFSGDGYAAAQAQLHHPSCIAIDASLNLYIVDQDNNCIRKVSDAGIITTIAGKGTAAAGFLGDGGAATDAQLNTPCGVAVDVLGNIYIADGGNNRIRKIDVSGIISTIAGTNSQGYNGDGIAATNAELYFPYSVAVDVSGNVYVADVRNNRIRKIDASGIISTVAGNGTAGFSGDGGTATNAMLYDPVGVAIDNAGNLYLSDYYNNRIRRINTAGNICTIAGNGTPGFSGDGGDATDAQFNGTVGLSVDNSGNVYVADYNNNRIRQINTNGTINTVAGDGIAGFLGNAGLATGAELNTPTGLVAGTSDNIYIADLRNNCVRQVTNLTGINELGNNSKQINVYPNPSNGQITLALRNSKSQGIIIYDMLGKEVYADNFNAAQSNINLNLNLTDGIYIMKIQTSEGFLIERVEITK